MLTRNRKERLAAGPLVSVEIDRVGMTVAAGHGRRAKLGFGSSPTLALQAEIAVS